MQRKVFLIPLFSAILVVAIGGCLRPPGSKLISVKNECDVPVTVGIYYGSASKPPLDLERDLSWKLEVGGMRDEIFGTVGPGSDMVVAISGDVKQKRSWTAAELPSELRTSENTEGDAILLIYSDHMELRGKTGWERFEYFGGPQIVLVGVICCVVPLFAILLASRQRPKNKTNLTSVS